MNIELRDYFAAKAMQGLYANPDYTDHTAAVCAKWAYEMADAMLAAREAEKQKLDGGWIEWNGGECPVAPEAIVEVKLASKKFVTGMAEDYQWSNDDPWTVRIIAYRVVQP